MKTISTFFCLFFFITVNLFTSFAKAQINVNDSLTLVALYNSTNGTNWYKHNNWLTNKPVSTWFGVKVINNKVAGLNLSSNNLTGSIPAEIGNLKSLKNLYLNINNLSGIIPVSIGNLNNLELLILSDNKLIGFIPIELENLSKLELLYLFNNQLSGSIPSEICSLSNLTELILYNNKLSGTIPHEISKLKSLLSLNFAANQLTGSIPKEIGNLRNLKLLILYRNQFGGSIPTEIGNLKNLTSLDLAVNQLTDTIPAAIGHLDKLTSLDLSINKLTGSIPFTFRNFSRRSIYIGIDENHLSQYGNISFPISIDVNIHGFIRDNLFTFDGIEDLSSKYPNVNYAPQFTMLPIHKNQNSLSVYAGGTLSNNTFTWHQAGTTNETVITGDSIFSPVKSGKYYVTVSNAVATQLILHSDTIKFTLTPQKQSSNTLILKNVQAYPNPVRDVLHIKGLDANMNYTINISNEKGNVRLSSAIKNTTDCNLNVQELYRGIYYVNITSANKQMLVLKFVKE